MPPNPSKDMVKIHAIQPVSRQFRAESGGAARDRLAKGEPEGGIDREGDSSISLGGREEPPVYRTANGFGCRFWFAPGCAKGGSAPQSASLPGYAS